jgi:hypothetical protein
MKQKQIWIVMALLLGMGSVLYYFFFYRPYPKYDWTLTMNPSLKEPFDLGVFYNHLRNLPGITAEINKGKPLNKVPLKTDYQAYVFIHNRAPQFTPEDVDHLMDYLNNGGKALFISLELGDNLSRKLFREGIDDLILLRAEYQTPDDSLATRKVPVGIFNETKNPKATYFIQSADTVCRLKYPNFVMNGEWYYLKNPVRQIGFIGNQINFLELKVGKGTLLWNCNPFLFTNFHLLRPEIQEYADGVLSHLALKRSQQKPKKDGDLLSSIFSEKEKNRAGMLLIDEASKLPYWSEDGDQKPSPLRYILSQETFRWAWYTLLAGVIAFLVLLARRRQRIIPLMPSRTNSTLHFIRAISELYLRKQNHYFMSEQKMKLFINHIKTRYGIQNQGLSKESIQVLSRRSGVDEELITSIFQTWNYIQDYSMQNTTASQLAHFHSITEQFYQQSKSL